MGSGHIYIDLRNDYADRRHDASGSGQLYALGQDPVERLRRERRNSRLQRMEIREARLRKTLQSGYQQSLKGKHKLYPRKLDGKRNRIASDRLD